MVRKSIKKSDQKEQHSEVELSPEEIAELLAGRTCGCE